jgi:RNA polymerase-binding protein DksA
MLAQEMLALGRQPFVSQHVYASMMRQSAIELSCARVAVKIADVTRYSEWIERCSIGSFEERDMLTENEIRLFRQRLLALGSRVSRQREQLKDEALRPVGGEASGSFSDVPTHPADLGTHYFEEEVALGLVENEEQIIAEINAALERIEQGSFGRCEKCGREIAGQRLQAVPYARHCIDCARRTSA